MPVTEKIPGPGGMPKQLALAMVQRDWQVKKVCLRVSVAIVDERDEKTKSQREIQVVRTCCVNGRPALCFLSPSKSLCRSPVVEYDWLWSGTTTITNTPFTNMKLYLLFSLYHSYPFYHSLRPLFSLSYFLLLSLLLFLLTIIYSPLDSTIYSQSFIVPD